MIMLTDRRLNILIAAIYTFYLIGKTIYNAWKREYLNTGCRTKEFFI
jgi:hypothetical protein